MNHGVAQYCLALLAAGALLLAATPAAAGLSKGETVYVPCSSHIYQGVRTRPFDLTVTLLVRNADPRRSLTLASVDYYGTNGRLLRRMLGAVVVLPPLSAREFVVEQKDSSGGAGASFLVRWRARAPMNEPVVEAVMIGTTNSQGISFVSRGVPVRE